MRYIFSVYRKMKALNGIFGHEKIMPKGASNIKSPNDDWHWGLSRHTDGVKIVQGSTTRFHGLKNYLSVNHEDVKSMTQLTSPRVSLLVYTSYICSWQTLYGIAVRM